jgi:hypothetical protein
MLSLVLSLHLNPYDSLLLVLPAVLFYNYLKLNSSRLAFGIFMLCCPYIFLVDFFVLHGQMGFHFPFLLMVFMMAWMAKELLSGKTQKDVFAVETVSKI